MLAMALLLYGGLLGGMGGEAAGVDGPGEGARTLTTPAEGFLAALGTDELAHLLHLCLFRAFACGASLDPPKKQKKQKRKGLGREINQVGCGAKRFKGGVRNVLYE
eukprot:COSAG02_NODE_5012_length_4724_cov_73.188324_4_plen_106_part_00